MNPQYAPPQQFGAAPQNFPPSQSSPSLMAQPGQNFQNVPLGPSKPGPGGPPPRFTGSVPQNSIPGQFPPSMGGPATKSQIPQSQLPPPPQSLNAQDHSNNPFTNSQDAAETGIQNEPSKFQNGSSYIQNAPQQHFQGGAPQFQNGLLPGQAPPLVQPYKPTLQTGVPPNSSGVSNRNNFTQPPLPGATPIQNVPARPPSNQPTQIGHPPLPGGQIPLSNQSNPLGHPPLPGGQMAPPGQQPPSNFGPSSMGTNQYNQQTGAPPTNQPQNVPPIQPQVPLRSGPPQNFGPPPHGQGSFNQPPVQNIPYQYPTAQIPRGPQMPQPPAQPPYAANQLPNQMQNMNLNNSQRQYPGGPMKTAINGEPGPHMLPPLNQAGYVNGAQMRAPPGPGYPPMPGQGPMPTPGAMPSGPGTYPQPNYQQQQQQNRRLDPDQMPSPIQVTLDDQQNRSGTFITNQKGLVPPLVSTNFVVQDQGNASPRLIRSTMYNVPISQDIIKNTAVPFSLVISPMARHIEGEYPPPIVNFGELGPVRCIRCKAYMCPFMQFIDSGRRFQCLFCKATTDVPSEYFQHLDHTGHRMDRYERPELVLGTYEFVATADYCRNNVLPKPPAIIFIIDVSYNNVKSGLVHLVCSQMKEIIQNLPCDQGQDKSNMRVGFITYNSSVHFYNIKGTLAAPQMLMVGDVQEMFMPLLDGFLCSPEESGVVIDALMEQIPAMFGDTRETETVLLPAIQAGLEALKASECVGKLLVFHSTLPSADAPGRLRNRDDRKLLGTDKEKTVLAPQNQAYNQLGQDCVAVGCSVDLFIFNNAYIDLATIGQVARLTGGEIFKYTYFQADIDGERLVNDIIMNISRPIAFDGVMRVRTSTGVRPTDFYGHFYMSNTTDMELASIDSDKAVAVEIKHDDKLSEDEGVYVQVALLYTSCSGQRRLRIMNLSLKTCSLMTDLYRSCDLDTMINYVSKQAVYKLLDNNPKVVKDAIVNRAAQILATYRKNCASPSSSGQLILPECMKLLPLYVNCLLKSDALSGSSEMTIDDRSFVMQAVMTMDIPTSANYFYPRLIPLHELDPNEDPVTVPAPIRSTIEKINEQGVYILENGIHMFLWFGLGVNPEFIQKLFGAPSAIQVDIDRVCLPELDNSLSLAVRSIIDEIRIQRHRCMRLTVVRQREKLEPVFKHFLIEDRGSDASPSYVDFLCHLHKEIRTILS